MQCPLSFAERKHAAEDRFLENSKKTFSLPVNMQEQGKRRATQGSLWDAGIAL